MTLTAAINTDLAALNVAFEGPGALAAALHKVIDVLADHGIEVGDYNGDIELAQLVTDAMLFVGDAEATVDETVEALFIYVDDANMFRN